MTKNEQQDSRRQLVEYLRDNFNDQSARAALADWEREYGDPAFGDFLDVSLHDLLKHGGHWDEARGYKMFRKEFVPLVLGDSFHPGANWSCSGTYPAEDETERVISAAPSVPMAPGLMKLTAFMEPEGFRQFGCYLKGGLLFQLFAPVDWWRANGRAVLDRSPLQLVQDTTFAPNRVKRRSKGRGNYRYAWFNKAEVDGDGRFIVNDACRLPADVFLLLEGRNERAARYDSEKDALDALSDALMRLVRCRAALAT